MIAAVKILTIAVLFSIFCKKSRKFLDAHEKKHKGGIITNSYKTAKKLLKIEDK